jgi:hypothetical protein
MLAGLLTVILSQGDEEGTASSVDVQEFGVLCSEVWALLDVYP